jgi:hypothetical protein
MAEELRAQCLIIRKKLYGSFPKQLWLSVSSGTLAGIFREVLGPDIKIKAVNAGPLSSDDPRIQALASDQNLTLFTPPDIPANAYFDAKVWQFLLAQGRAGDLWWNMSR